MKKRHTLEQLVRKLRQAEAELAAGASFHEVARRLGISEATFHRWRNQYGGMKANAMKRLKELEKENARLKKIVADQAVDIDILKEVSRETSRGCYELAQKRLTNAENWGPTETELTETFAFLCGFPAEFITRSKPDSEESCRRAGLSATGDLRASGVRGDRPAQIEPALRGPQGGKGPPTGQTDGRALAGESALGLQAGVGAPEARRLAGEQEAGASAVALGRPQSAPEATQEAAPSPGRERERMYEEACRAQRPRLEL